MLHAKNRLGSSMAAANDGRRGWLWRAQSRDMYRCEELKERVVEFDEIE